MDKNKKSNSKFSRIMIGIIVLSMIIPVVGTAIGLLL